MAVASMLYGPYDQSGGNQTIALTSQQRTRFNQSVALKFVDTNGAVVVPASGTMNAHGRREGGSLYEPFDSNPIDITKVGGWPQTQDPVDSIIIEPVGLPASLRYYVIINSLSISS